MLSYMSDSEPTKRARIWSGVLIAGISALSAGAGVHYWNKPREDRMQAEAISDAVRLAIQQELIPLRDRINNLDSRLLLAESNTATLRAQLVPRIDQLTASVQSVADSVNKTSSDVSYMRGKLEGSKGGN